MYKKIKRSWLMIKTRGIKFFLNRFLVSRSCRFRLSNFYFGQPTIVDLEVTTRCNLTCIQCPRQGDFAHLVVINKDLPQENFIKIFHKLPYLETMVFSGLGDPLLYPPIFEIIGYLRQKNPYINIFVSTNGSVFQNEIKLNQVLNSGINNLQISWNGAKAETLKKLQGLTNFEKIFNNLRLLLKNKRENLNVSLNFVLMPENYHELVEYVRLANFLGVNKISVNRRNYAAFTDKKVDPELFYSSPDLQNQIKQAEAEAVKLGIYFSYHFVSKCSSLWDTVVIDINGEVLPCYGRAIIPGRLSVGNILTQSYSEIAKSDILKRLRKSVAGQKKLDYCHNCYLV